jgi:cation diffusion facilitator family transporter
MVNFFVAIVLSRAGKKYHSITLVADAKHLMTDVWTSAGVIVGLVAVSLTGWAQIDAIVAFLVACNIIWAGISIVRSSVAGLMDKSLSADEQNTIQKALEPYKQKGIQFHALLTRQAGARKFVSFHVLVPGTWSVQQGHQLSEQIEADIRTLLPNVNISTHLEPIEDPVSYYDMGLERDEIMADNTLSQKTL